MIDGGGVAQPTAIAMNAQCPHVSSLLLLSSSSSAPVPPLHFHPTKPIFPGFSLPPSSQPRCRRGSFARCCLRHGSPPWRLRYAWPMNERCVASADYTPSTTPRTMPTPPLGLANVAFSLGTLISVDLAVFIRLLRTRLPGCPDGETSPLARQLAGLTSDRPYKCFSPLPGESF